jgi:hypothetical protein
VALDDIKASSIGVTDSGEPTWVMPEETIVEVKPEFHEQPLKPELVKPSTPQVNHVVIPTNAQPSLPVAQPPVANSTVFTSPPTSALSNNSDNSVAQVSSEQNNSLMPVPKKSIWGKLIALIVLVIVLLVLVFVGAIYADDQGLYASGISAKMSKLPLSSLWGGLSSVPSSASSQLSTAQQSVLSVHYIGNINGWGSVANVSNDIASSDPFIASGSYNFSADSKNFLFNYQSVFGDNHVVTEYRGVDGIIYEGHATAGSENSLDWGTSSQTSLLNAVKVKDLLVSMVSRSVYVGREKLNTGDAYHYKADITSSDLSLLLEYPSLSDWNDASGIVDIWISRKSHIVQKFMLSLTQSGNNAKKISIEANANSSIEKIEVPSVLADTGTETKTSDELRKSDIIKIQQALAKYYSDRSSYPISPVIENLSTATSALSKSLVPLYLDIMPADPFSTHYYGYKSDGKDYELTAVLDDITDPEGMQIGAVFLYKVTASAAPTPSSSTSSLAN